MEKTSLLVRTIPMDELESKEYKEFIGYLFQNENGKYNICLSEEEIIKSNKWFKNLPKRVLVVSEEPHPENPILVGDKFIAVCGSETMNNKVFTYIGISEKGVDLIDLIDEDGEEVLTTKHILTNSIKYFGIATLEDLKTIVDSQ